MKKDTLGVKIRIETMLPLLDERQRRIFLATEAKTLGHGGISQVSALSGVSRVTITQGIKEIENPITIEKNAGRCRIKGGGRKSINITQPGIAQELEILLEGYTKGDPMKPLIWTSKSARNLEKALKDKGYKVSHMTVLELLKALGLYLVI
jgi:DNA-binding phage protein